MKWIDGKINYDQPGADNLSAIKRAFGDLKRGNFKLLGAKIARRASRSS
jgi:hypothetical protein